YTTPDPSLRPVPSAILPRETSERSDGLTEVRVMLDRASPYQELHGHLLAEVEEGRVVGTIPASEWFCRFSRPVAPGIVASHSAPERTLATVSCRRPEDSFAGLEQHMRFYQPVPANGQLVRVETKARRVPRRGGDLNEATSTIYDAGGAVVA